MSTTQFKLGSIVRLKLIMKMKHVKLCSQCRHQKFPTPPLCAWWSLLVLPVASGASFRCFSFIPQSKDILCCRIICIYKSISSVCDGLVPCPWCPPPFTPSPPWDTLQPLYHPVLQKMNGLIDCFPDLYSYIDKCSALLHFSWMSDISRSGDDTNVFFNHILGKI